jgi:hypothetical protein
MSARRPVARQARQSTYLRVLTWSVDQALAAVPSDRRTGTRRSQVVAGANPLCRTQMTAGEPPR